MKLLYNKTNDLYLRIDDMILAQVAETKKGLSTVYAIVICMPTHAPTPIVFFSDKTKAQDCLLRIIEFYRDSVLEGHDISVDKDILTVEDDVKESILVAPDVVKGKKPVLN